MAVLAHADDRAVLRCDGLVRHLAAVHIVEIGHAILSAEAVCAQPVGVVIGQPVDRDLAVRDDLIEVVLIKIVHIHVAADPRDCPPAGVLPHFVGLGIGARRVILRDPVIPGDRRKPVLEPVLVRVNHAGVARILHDLTERVHNRRLCGGRETLLALVLDIKGNRERNRVARHGIHRKGCILCRLLRGCRIAVDIGAGPEAGLCGTDHVLRKLRVQPILRVADADHREGHAGGCHLTPVDAALIGGHIDAEIGNGERRRIRLLPRLTNTQRSRRKYAQHCGSHPFHQFFHFTSPAVLRRSGFLPYCKIHEQNLIVWLRLSHVNRKSQRT